MSYFDICVKFVSIRKFHSNLSKEDFLEFLDRKVMVVNKAADASKDPTIIPYNLQPDLLLDKIFELGRRFKCSKV